MGAAPIRAKRRTEKHEESNCPFRENAKACKTHTKYSPTKIFLTPQTLVLKEKRTFKLF